MSGYPTPVRTEPSPTNIISGYPISAVQQWQPIAGGVNWLNGTGAMLIPAHSTKLSQSEIAAAGSGTWRFRVKPRKQAIGRVWAVLLAGRDTEHGVTASLQANGGTTLSGLAVTSSTYTNVPFIYEETLAAQSSTQAEINMTVAATGGYVTVQSISCWEQWRPALSESASDHGFNFTTVRPRERVYVGSYPTTSASVGGIYSALADSDPRRVGLFHWSVPDANPATRTGAYQSILGLTAPILTRRLTSAQAAANSTGTVYWAAYAKVNAGNGDIQITTTHSAVSDSVNVTSTVYAWTTARAISVDCEDIAAADGLQSATWDMLDVKIQGNGGNTISVAAVSIWEE